jgi:peptide/nickel transport system permease protein
VSAISRTVRPPPSTAPAGARLGLLLPGLGHLLAGEWLLGVGLIGLVAQLGWAVIAGLPRLGALLGSHGTSSAWQWHAMLATATVPALAAACWRAAWRHAHPVEDSTGAASSNWNLFVRSMRRNRNGMLGVVGATWLISLTVLTPLLAPFDPDAVSVGPQLVAPSAAHLMGTDSFGRDQFSRVLFGARISMVIGFIAVGIAATIGTLLGSIAGYFGGRIDRALMWVVDLLLSTPRLVLLLAIVGSIRPTGTNALLLIVVVLGLTGWMGVSRIVRSQVLSLKEQDFVQAARAVGLSDRRIIVHHLIPNALAPVVVYCSLAVGATMTAEAGLSFLGLGVQPPTSTWGTLVADGRQQMQTAPWLVSFPGIAIVLAVMSFNLLGDGLRDALDPKQRQ